MAEASFECDADADYYPKECTQSPSSASSNGNNQTSNVTQVITQGGNGPTCTTLFTECLPRPKRCVCLGDIDNADHAELLLDMYCR